MRTEDYTGVWVFVEQRNGRLVDVGLELLGGSRKIADKVRQELSAVVLGHNIASLANELAAYGADRVYLVDSPVLEIYRDDAYSLTLASLINRFKPSIFLFGGTFLGTDLAPRVAAKVRTGLSAHAVDIDVDEDGCLVAHVPAFGGSVMASITCAKHRPQMATIPAGFMRRPEKKPGRKAQIERIVAEVTEAQVRTKVIQAFHEETKSGSLSEAEIIVSGGYGVGSKENWRMVEQLAAVLGGVVGATRPACDEGWARLEDEMIGQSGKTVRPKLYIGIGISGAVHHLIGIKDSKVITSINIDPKAPIIQASDYAITADYRQVVPALIEELGKLRRSSSSEASP